MAVFTFDIEKNSISILLEKTDIVRYIENNIITTGEGEDYFTGKVFINGELPVCIIRGERNK